MFRSLKSFSIIYGVIMLIYMISIYLELVVLHNAVKPLFMVLLMLFVHQQIEGKYSTFYKLIQFGLFFSWLGDISLMIDKSGIWFILGLGSFLIAHLGYSVGFYRNIKDSNTPFNYAKAAGLAAPFFLVTGPFFYYIKDGLIFMQDGVEQNMTIPVLAYTVVISVMGMFSAWRLGHVHSKSFNWMFLGAILFILSDCVLALNIFSIRPEPFSDMSKGLRIANMILYLGGQFFIAFGAIFQERESA